MGFTGGGEPRPVSYLAEDLLQQGLRILLGDLPGGQGCEALHGHILRQCDRIGLNGLHTLSQPLTSGGAVCSEFASIGCGNPFPADEEFVFIVKSHYFEHLGIHEPISNSLYYNCEMN